MVGHTSRRRGLSASRRMAGRKLLSSAAVTAALVGSSAFAGQIWDGEGVNDNFGTAANWDSNTLPNFAAAVQFAGSTRLTPQQDLLNRTIGGFQFNSGAGSFTIGGLAMVASGGFTNLSGVNQTINIDINLSTGVKDFIATSGDLTINGVLSGTAIARTPITGTPAGIVYLNNLNQHSGGTQANANGTIAFGNDGAAGSGALMLAGGTVQAAGGARTLSNALTLSANSVISGSLALTFTGKLTQASTLDRTLTVNNSALTTFGAIDLASTTPRKLVFAGSGDIEINGLIANGGTTTSSGLTYSGTSTLKLSGTSNSYGGVTTIGVGSTIAAAGLGLGNANSSIGASSNAAANLSIDGGTIKYIGTGSATVDRSFTLGTNGGTIDASGGGALDWTPAVALAFVNVNNTRTLTFTGTSTAANTYGAIIANSAPGLINVAKNGSGTWVLSAANSYTGPTTVNDGTLLISGSTSATSVVTVNKGTLGGAGNGSTTGKIGGAITVGNGVLTASARDAILAPGPGVGTLLTGSLTFNADGIYAVDVNGSTPSTADRTSVTGGVTLGSGTAALSTLYISAGLAANQKYFVLVNDLSDAVSGYFAGLQDVNGALSSDDPIVLTDSVFDLRISYTGDFDTSAITGGNDIVLYSAASVPEPVAMGSVAFAAVSLMMRRRRRSASGATEKK